MIDPRFKRQLTGTAIAVALCWAAAAVITTAFAPREGESDNPSPEVEDAPG